MCPSGDGDIEDFIPDACGTGTDNSSDGISEQTVDLAALLKVSRDLGHKMRRFMSTAEKKLDQVIASIPSGSPSEVVMPLKWPSGSARCHQRSYGVRNYIYLGIPSPYVRVKSTEVKRRDANAVK